MISLRNTQGFFMITHLQCNPAALMRDFENSLMRRIIIEERKEWKENGEKE